MSLMLKLLTITVLISSSLFADSKALLTDYLELKLDNPKLTDLTVRIVGEEPLSQVDAWSVFLVQVDAKSEGKPLSKKVPFFVSGTIMAPMLVDMRTATPIEPGRLPEDRATAQNDTPSGDALIEAYLKRKVNNPDVTSLDVKVANILPLPQLPGWSAYMMDFNAMVKGKAIKQRMVYFISGHVIATDLIDLKSTKSLKTDIKPKFKSEFYSKANLLYGNENARHKVAIFSDPLCPFCRRFVPKAIEEMRQHPDTFAVYYYHMPLPTLHPAAVTMVKAAIAAEIQGHKDVVMRMYAIKSINARETDPSKILMAFNNEMGTRITLNDIRSEKVVEHFERDFQVANYLLVSGTPTVYIDGEIDGSKTTYKKFLGK